MVSIGLGPWNKSWCIGVWYHGRVNPECDVISMLNQMRESFFTGKQLNKSVHADEAVAHEAAWLATKLGGYEVYPLIQSLVLMDVTLDSLRIDHAIDPRFSDEDNKTRR